MCPRLHESTLLSSKICSMQKSHGKMLNGQKVTIFRKAVIMVIFGDFAKGLIRPNGQKWPISGVNLNRPKTYQFKVLRGSQLIKKKKDTQSSTNKKILKWGEIGHFRRFFKWLMRSNGQRWPILGVNLSRPKTQSPSACFA